MTGVCVCVCVFFFFFLKSSSPLAAQYLHCSYTLTSTLMADEFLAYNNLNNRTNANVITDMK